MKSLKRDTLAYQLGVRPGFARRNMGAFLVPKVVDSMKSFMNCVDTGSTFGLPFNPKGNPERDGLIFYLLNHVVSMIRQEYHPYESLGDKLQVVERYNQELAIRATRLFYYLLVICTRESRHVRNGQSSNLMKGLRKQYGDAIADFNFSIQGVGSTGAVDALLTNPPDATIGEYTAFLSDVFAHGKYYGGYGGKAWAEVADVLRDYVNGTLSAEMMMDTGFTLAHNNGPIFNKGVLYEGYSDEIYKILDVQRSGQIPQLIGNGETHWSSHLEITDCWGVCKEAMGSKLNGHVDWYLVEELGATKLYPVEKAKQAEKYDIPPKIKAKVMAEQIKAKEAEEKKKEQEAWEAASTVIITPYTKVKKVEVKR